MRRTRARRPHVADGGFTLVELLVVMVVLGILAAVAIPAFVAQKRKAYEASAKSDVKAISKEVVAFYVDGSGALTLANGSTTLTWELRQGATTVAAGRLSPGNEVAGSAIASDSSYCVAVRPIASGARAWRSDGNGLSAGTC